MSKAAIPFVALLLAKNLELQNRKAIPIIRTHKRLSANVRAWRCGDIPCYVSLDILLSKDMKIKIFSIAWIYWSD
jgi:hypothetical protein